MPSERLLHFGKELEQFGFEIDPKRTGYVEATDHVEVPFTGWVLEAVKRREMQDRAELSQNFFTRIPRPVHGDQQVKIEKSDRTVVHKKFALTPLQEISGHDSFFDPSKDDIEEPHDSHTNRIEVDGMSQEEIAMFLSDYEGWRLEKETWVGEKGMMKERTVLIKDEPH